MWGNDLDHVTCASSVLCLSSSPLISRCGRMIQTKQNLSFPLNKIILRKSGFNCLFVATVFACVPRNSGRVLITDILSAEAYVLNRENIFRNNRNCVYSNTGNVGIWWDETVPRVPQGSCFTQMTKQAPPLPTVMHSRNEARDQKDSQYLNILCTRVHSRQMSGKSHRRIIDADVQVRFQSTPPGICGGQSEIETGSSPSTFPVFPSQ
jgi:hypothetical protein